MLIFVSGHPCHPPIVFETNARRVGIAARLAPQWLLGFERATLPETNSSPLKMDGWNTSFLLGWPIFRGEQLVSERV